MEPEEIDFSSLPGVSEATLPSLMLHLDVLFQKLMQMVQRAEEMGLLGPRAQRSCWIREWVLRREDFGAYDNLMKMLREGDVAGFSNFMRMPPQAFDEMLQRITPRIQKHDTWFRKALTPGLKLAITLRYLATGDSYMSLEYLFYVPHNSISLLVKEVCEAIFEEYGSQNIKCPTTPDGWKEVARDFWRLWNFPNTIGAIDGKHIAIKKPPHAGSLYFNYKHFHSIILLAVVDAHYKFIWVKVGPPGSAGDAQVWNGCNFKDDIEDNRAGLPDPEPYPGDDTPMPYHLIGDDAFGLREFMMKPFGHRQLTDEERIFNYRLSRARRVVENAFGILAHRYRCLLKRMEQKTETVELVVLACISLHNLMRERYPGEGQPQPDQEDANHNLVPGEWRRQAQMEDMEERLTGNTATRAAKNQRLYLKHYLNGEAGSVAWQRRLAQLPPL